MALVMQGKALSHPRATQRVPAKTPSATGYGLWGRQW
jgi:hypothetical protein